MVWLVTNDPYDPSAFPPFAVTVDLVVLTVRPPDLRVLLIRRDQDPQRGSWALPGGFVGPDQDLADAARHKLADKTGVHVATAHLEQLRTFGAPDRDPRMRVVSVAHLALVSDPPEPDQESAQWHSVQSIGQQTLAFDHAEVLSVGVERARSKLEYSMLATSFCAPEFTIADLRAVYEAVWGQELDPANFHRKVLAVDGFVEPTGNTESGGRGRPARTYQAGGADTLHPPIVRPSPV